LKTLIVRLPFRFAASLPLLLSAAWAAEDIRVEALPDGVIVRSPAAAANFLFRAPKAFREVDVPEGFVAALAAEEDGSKATIRLRLGELTATEARAGLDAFVKARDAEYRAGLGGAPGITGGRGRRLVAIEGEGSLRLVLALFDGPRRYELFLDATPGDSALAAQLAAVAEGFTLLDPKGPPDIGPATEGDDKAATIEHDYYRLKLVKPKGFLQQEVDPDRDAGIFLHLRREDEQKNRCDIRIRVFLAKALKESVDAKAEKRLEEFKNGHETPRAPSRPTRGRWAGASTVYRMKLAGRLPSGSVVEEEWLILDHENGRVYEIEVGSFGGAARAFKKEIDAFWRGLKITDR
jgi:hypothetical protein